MHEHAKTQINKPLLQFQKRQFAARSHARFVLYQNGAAMTKEHCGSRSLGGQLEELSPCGHLRSLPQMSTITLLAKSDMASPCERLARHRSPSCRVGKRVLQKRPKCGDKLIHVSACMSTNETELRRRKYIETKALVSTIQKFG